MSTYTKNRKVICTRKSDGKQREFNTISEASIELGVSRHTIAQALKNPFHYAHRYGYKKLKDGTISMSSRQMPYDFSWSDDAPVVELWCDDPETPRSFKAPSHTKAIQFLGCARATYYKRMATAKIGEPCPEPIFDRTGVPWLLVFNVAKQEPTDQFKPKKPQS